MVDILAEVDAAMAALAAEARRSLVQVRDGRRGSGAGTIWHPQGLIVTNAHVASRQTLEVLLADGRALPARVHARDEALDLAALTVEADDLPAVRLGSSRDLRPGEWVLAVGHPWGVAGAATAGVVIGVGPGGGEPPLDARQLIAVSLHLRPGHSGGALVDAAGRLVGISTMMAGPDVGLAVPVDVVKRFIKQAFSPARLQAA